MDSHNNNGGVGVDRGEGIKVKNADVIETQSSSNTIIDGEGANVADKKIASNPKSITKPMTAIVEQVDVDSGKEEGEIDPPSPPPKLNEGIVCDSTTNPNSNTSTNSNSNANAGSGSVINISVNDVHLSISGINQSENVSLVVKRNPSQQQKSENSESSSNSNKNSSHSTQVKSIDRSRKETPSSMDIPPPSYDSFVQQTESNASTSNPSNVHYDSSTKSSNNSIESKTNTSNDKGLGVESNMNNIISTASTTNSNTVKTNPKQSTPSQSLSTSSSSSTTTTTASTSSTNIAATTTTTTTTSAATATPPPMVRKKRNYNKNLSMYKNISASPTGNSSNGISGKNNTDGSHKTLSSGSPYKSKPSPAVDPRDPRSHHHNHHHKTVTSSQGTAEGVLSFARPQNNSINRVKGGYSSGRAQHQYHHIQQHSNSSKANQETPPPPPPPLPTAAHTINSNTSSAVTISAPNVQIRYNKRDSSIRVLNPMTRGHRLTPVNQYEMIERVGKGQYGEVYKARRKDKVSGGGQQLCALKKFMLDTEVNGFPVTAIREISLMKRLNHDNVLCISDICYSERNDYNRMMGSIYIAVEWMDHDLAGLLQRPDIKFSPAQVKGYFKQLLDGLYYLHVNHRIVHRDLKSANILINNKGLLKIADFGLAREMPKKWLAYFRIFDRRYKSEFKRGLTNRVVTLWYRPPELLFGSTNYDFKIDMWGAGCLLAEMFEKSPILKGNTEMAQIKNICQLTGTPNETNWPGVNSLPEWKNIKIPAHPSRIRERFKASLTPEALNLLEKLLCNDPNQRFSASEALDHDYFWEELPDPLKPEQMPTYGSSHEMQIKLTKSKMAHRMHHQQHHQQRMSTSNKYQQQPNQNQSHSSYNKYNTHGGHAGGAGAVKHNNHNNNQQGSSHYRHNPNNNYPTSHLQQQQGSNEKYQHYQHHHHINRRDNNSNSNLNTSGGNKRSGCNLNEKDNQQHNKRSKSQNSAISGGQNNNNLHPDF